MTEKGEDEERGKNERKKGEKEKKRRKKKEEKKIPSRIQTQDLRSASEVIVPAAIMCVMLTSSEYGNKTKLQGHQTLNCIITSGPCRSKFQSNNTCALVI